MEGNFLSRYNSIIQSFLDRMNDDNRKEIEYEMSEYMTKCIPYMNKYTDDMDHEINTDNIFNCKEHTGLKKRDIYQEYLVDVENANIYLEDDKKIDKCKNCNISNIFHFNETSELICEQCGLVVDTLLSDELTYREEQETSEKIINYSYKRENHFNEWLSQFQAQETTNIPQDVFDKLRNEFKKTKIKKLDEITHAKVRNFLKKLHMNKYYEHVPYITNILNGINAPKMPEELEERLRIMFKEIQKPFNDNCPSERKNFLSYSYVLYKFCELLEQDEYLKYFPLLKSKEKLYQQDVIWKSICKDLKWEFIPTI